MEWQQIIGFSQLVRLGTFTKAAQATFRTQSALSQQIKSLEAELGCTLVERIGRGQIRLTMEGELFWKFAQTVLEQKQGLYDDLNELKSCYRGTVSMAAPFTTLTHLLPPIVKKFRQLAPLVKPRLLDRSWRNTISLVADGEIDFGVCLESDPPKNLSVTRWMPLQTVLLVPLKHPLSGTKRLELRDLVEFPLILPPKDLKYPIREKLDKLLADENLDSHVLLETTNVELNAAYVEMGLGVSFGTTVHGHPFFGKWRLEMVPMDHFFPEDHLMVTKRRNVRLPKYKQLFWDCLFGNEW